MEKTKNKYCFLREFDYNQEKQVLVVKYIGDFAKTINNFSNSDYQKLLKANKNGEMLIPILNKLVKDKKEQLNKNKDKKT